MVLNELNLRVTWMLLLRTHTGWRCSQPVLTTWLQRGYADCK